eukprot:g27690.t1
MHRIVKCYHMLVTIVFGAVGGICSRGDATVGGIPPQVLSDERLARLLQEQSPTTVAESPVEASHQATAIHAYVHEDEELARLLQAEEDDTRTASHSTAPPRRRHGHDPRGGTSAWPLLLSVLSSGACFGGCAGCGAREVSVAADSTEWPDPAVAVTELVELGEVWGWKIHSQRLGTQ